MIAVNRRTGSPIVRTLERVYGTADIQPDRFSRDSAGRIVHRYADFRLAIDWDSSKLMAYIDKNDDQVEAEDIELRETEKA